MDGNNQQYNKFYNYASGSQSGQLDSTRNVQQQQLHQQQQQQNNTSFQQFQQQQQQQFQQFDQQQQQQFYSIPYNYYNMVDQQQQQSAATPQQEFNLQQEDFPALGSAAAASSAAAANQQYQQLQQQQQQQQLLQQQQQQQQNNRMKATWDGSVVKSQPKQSISQKDASSSRSQSRPPAEDPAVVKEAQSNTTQLVSGNQTENPNNSSSAMNGSQSQGDRFGLVGLLGVIRMTDADLNTLALGTDLTTLGLDLSSEQSLCTTFSGAVHHNVELMADQIEDLVVPPCYLEDWNAASEQKMELLSDETLLFLFYSSADQDAQLASCRELCTRGWQYHKLFQVWIDSTSQQVWDCQSWSRMPIAMKILPQDLITITTIDKIFATQAGGNVSADDKGLLTKDPQSSNRHRGSMLLSSGNELIDGGDPVLYNITRNTGISINEQGSTAAVVSREKFGKR